MALREKSDPLSPNDLASVLDGVEVAAIGYHMGRLRKIEAIEYAVEPGSLRALDVPHRRTKPDYGS